MVKIDFRLFLPILLTGMLLTQVAIVSAEVEDFFLPSAKVTSADFEADDHNDIVVRSEPYQNFGRDRIWSETEVNQYNHFEDQRDFMGMRTENTPFLSSHPNIMSFENTTNERTNLHFRGEYYSLFEGSSQELGKEGEADSEPRNIKLTAYDYYGFVLDFDELTPSFIRILATQISFGTAFTLNIQIYDPDGELTSRNYGIAKNVENFIPLVPQMEGKHYVFFRPYTNVILSEVEVLNNPEIETTSNGLFEEFDGEEAVAKFIRISPDINPQSIEIDAIITQNTYEGRSYYGNLRLFVFNQFYTDILGTTFSSATYVTNSVIYVAVIATPPDDSDPVTEAAKADANLEEGMLLDYTLIVTRRSIPALPINQNFVPISPTQNGGSYRYYRVVFDQEVLLSVNSTATVSFVTFVRQDGRMDQFTVNGYNNDIIGPDKPYGTYPYMIPSGLYVVLVPLNYQIQFRVFEPETLERGETTISLAPGESRMFKLPLENFTRDLLNVTYTNPNNASNILRATLFSNDGGFQQEITTNFTNFYFNGSLELNNFTQIFTSAGLEETYLLLENKRSVRYDENGTISQVNSATLSLTINRSNHFQKIFNEVNGTNYITHNLENDFFKILNGSNSDLQSYFHLNVKKGSAYRIMVESVNSTIDVANVFFNTNTIWISKSQTVPTLVNNQTHYKLKLVFAATESKTMGLFLWLGTLLGNGSISVSVEDVEVKRLPGLNLEVIEISKIEGEDRLRQILIYGAGGILALTVIALVIRRRFF